MAHMTKNEAEVITKSCVDKIKEFNQDIKKSKSIADDIDKFCHDLIEDIETLPDCDDIVDPSNEVMARVVQDILDRNSDTDLRKKFQFFYQALTWKSNNPPKTFDQFLAVIH